MKNTKDTSSLASVLNNQEIDEIYFNGFQVAIGNGDVLVVLSKNGSAKYKLNMSFTMAKTLSEKLGLLIAEFERITENTIITTDEIDRKTKS